MGILQPSSGTNNGEEIDLALRELALPSLSHAHLSHLNRPFSGEEIRKALFSIANNKSPGLNGSIVEFFKIHWTKIGPSFIEAVQSFFSSGYLLKEWNQSILVMLPKVEAPQEAAHLRSISLCNTIYKCVAKCMAFRLKRVLPSLI